MEQVSAAAVCPEITPLATELKIQALPEEIAPAAKLTEKDPDPSSSKDFAFAFVHSVSAAFQCPYCRI